MTPITEQEQELPLPDTFWEWLDATRPELRDFLSGRTTAVVCCNKASGRIRLRFPGLTVEPEALFDRQQYTADACIVADNPTDLGFTAS